MVDGGWMNKVGRVTQSFLLDLDDGRRADAKIELFSAHGVVGVIGLGGGGRRAEASGETPPRLELVLGMDELGLWRAGSLVAGGIN